MTVLRMDIVRSQMTEPTFHIVRNARDITSPQSKNNVYQWSQTGTYTLKPINFTTDFEESASWEKLKFRLSDCVYNPDWWVEVPNNSSPTTGGPADYFCNLIVKKENWSPTGGSSYLIQHPASIGPPAEIGTNNYEQDHSLLVLASSSPQPANQGYCIRFRIDGRPSTTRAALLDFYFGEFMLRLNSFGEAQVWQSVDFVNYGYVYAWQWALADQIHGRMHRISVFPHARNKVEFASYNPAIFLGRTGRYDHTWGKDGLRGHGLYEVPGQLVLDADGITPIITKPAPWRLGVSREFRPMVQVSRLGFANGGSMPAELWDTPQDAAGPNGGVFPPLAQPFANAEYDKNGCRVWWKVIDPLSGSLFVADGTKRTMQFGLGMTGLGDIAGPGLASSRSPEFYSYSIDKRPFFVTTPRQTIDVKGSHITVDSGISPEAERLSITTYDENAYRIYSERAEIPIELGDIETNLLYFEGTAFEVEATRCPAQTPNGLHIEAAGMAENLIRMVWPDNAPNFGVDTTDPQHRGWFVADVIRRTFESAGEDSANIIIEEAERYLKGFRLWTAPNGGGTGDGMANVTGSGHDVEGASLGRWHPRFGTPIYEFADMFIRSVLGWNWYRDRSDRKWHVYKRPDPNNSLDAAKMNPKVEFYTAPNRPTGNIPAYSHRRFTTVTKRPKYATIVLATQLWTSEIPDKATLAEILSRVKAGTDNPEDPLLKTEWKKMLVPFTNLKSYPNPKNKNPDITHPDFLGQNRVGIVKAFECNTPDSIQWIGRRLYEDNCQGHVQGRFEADWGDKYTYNLRKWDVVLLDRAKWYIAHVEPQWMAGQPKRAHYTVTKWRPDARPPK